MTDKKITAYPLCWPDGWPRTVARKSGSPGRPRNGTALREIRRDSLKQEMRRELKELLGL